MLAAGLIASRFLHFVAVLLLFGAAAFPLYAYREDKRQRQAELLFGRLRTPLLYTAILALVSGATWLSFTSASMSGSLMGAADPSIVSIVIRETDFGRIWIWRLALAAALVVLFLPKRRSELLSFLQIAGAALLLTTIAGTGHAGSDATDLGTFHVAADSLHLLAAAVWLGGLLPLAIIMTENEFKDVPGKVEILQRFSAMGTLAVAALAASGLVNTWFQVDSVRALVTTNYGRWLLIKVALFLAMLALAAANRLWIMPKLAHAPADAPSWLERLARHIAGEQALGFLVLLAVAVLGTLEPAHLQAE